MDTEPSLSYVFNQLIARLSDLTDITRQSIDRGSSTFPAHVFDEFGLLANNLTKVSQHIALLEKRRKDLHSLVDIGQVINSSLDPDEVLMIVMDTIIRLLKAERGFLMLNDKQGKLSMRVARNWTKETVQLSESAISRTVVKRVIADRKPVLTTNAQEDPRFGGQESVIAYHLRSILCVPLKVKDDLTGVIYADNRIHTGIFTEYELELLTAFANQAAVAIENARLFESLRQTLSEVTELKNLMDNVFASIASGVITTDIQEQITLCNHAAVQILGQTQDSMIGRNLKEVLPDQIEGLEVYIQRVRQAD